MVARVLGVHCSNTANKQVAATGTAEQVDTIRQDGERPHRGGVRGVLTHRQQSTPRRVSMLDDTINRVQTLYPRVSLPACFRIAY